MNFTKYVTLSFDDGLEQDKKIIEILKKYGLKATFNLNSGMFGQAGRIGRMGDYGMFNLPDKDSFKAKLLKAVPCCRIPEDEVLSVYDGFEIASHGTNHDNLSKLDETALEAAAGADIDRLSKIFGNKVNGYVYAYGGYSDKAIEYLKSKGILYARTTKSTGKFEFPENPLKFDPTAWLIEAAVPELIEQFDKAEANNGDLLLSLWGHGYEFDFGTPNCNWERFETLCKRLSELKDVVFCTNSEAFQRHE